MKRGLLGLVLLLAGTAALADVVHLTTGRSIKGKVVSEDDEQVVVKTPQGKLTLPRHLVKSVERESEGKTQLGLARERAAQGSYDVAVKLYERAAKDPDPHIARSAREELAALRKKLADRPASPAPPSGPEEPPPAPGAPAAQPVSRGEVIFTGGGEFASSPRGREVALALRRRDGRAALKLMEGQGQRDDASFHYLLARGFELTRRASQARRLYLSILDGRPVDRALPIAQLRELSRRLLGGFELNAGTPGVSKAWRRVETKHFAVYHSFDRVEPWFSRAPEEALDHVLSELGVRASEVVFSGPIQILLFPNVEEYQRSGGMQLAGGHATVRLAPDGFIKLITSFPVRRVYIDTYRHEIAHSVLMELFVRLPKWAQEGAAVWVESPRNKPRLWGVYKGLRAEDNLPPLEAYLRDEVSRGESQKQVLGYYAQAAVLFEAAVQLTGGTRPALELCLRMGEIGPMPALEEAGISLPQLQAACERAIGKY